MGIREERGKIKTFFSIIVTVPDAYDLRNHNPWVLITLLLHTYVPPAKTLVLFVNRTQSGFNYFKTGFVRIKFNLGIVARRPLTKIIFTPR